MKIIQRIKPLVIVSTIGLMPFSSVSASTWEKFKENKEEYLEALQQYESERPPEAGAPQSETSLKLKAWRLALKDQIEDLSKLNKEDWKRAMGKRKTDIRKLKNEVKEAMKKGGAKTKEEYEKFKAVVEKVWNDLYESQPED